MAKLKISDEELPVKELEDAEFNEDGEFEDYDGPDPPKGTILAGYVKKVWYTYTQYDDPMLKILWVADGNTGEEKEYEGLPVWDNAALTQGAKFKWAPFLRTFELTIRDVKDKTQAAKDEESNGKLIESIAGWEPGSDEAYCRIVTDRELYKDNWQTRIGRWLEWQEPDEEPEDEEPDEPEPDEKPRGRRAAAKATEPEPKPSATRGRRTAAAAKEEAKPAPRSRGRRAAKDDGDEPPF